MSQAVLSPQIITIFIIFGRYVRRPEW